MKSTIRARNQNLSVSPTLLSYPVQESDCCFQHQGLPPTLLQPAGKLDRQTKLANKSLADWIAEIQRCSTESTINTFTLAKIVHDAKCQLQYGQWTQLWRFGRIPFSKRKGEMLAVIGESFGNLDAQNSAHLPSAWNTLYYLARLERAVLENLIQDGTVHPALTLQQAKEILGKFRRIPQKKKTRLRHRFRHFQNFIRANSDAWTAEERDWARCELLRLAHQLAEFENVGVLQSPDHRDRGVTSVAQSDPQVKR